MPDGKYSGMSSSRYMQPSDVRRALLARYSGSASAPRPVAPSYRIQTQNYGAEAQSPFSGGYASRDSDSSIVSPSQPARRSFVGRAAVSSPAPARPRLDDPSRGLPPLERAKYYDKRTNLAPGQLPDSYGFFSTLEPDNTTCRKYMTKDGKVYKIGCDL